MLLRPWNICCTFSLASFSFSLFVCLFVCLFLLILLLLLLIIIIIILVITFMQGIYNFIPETNHVSKVYSVAAVLYLQFVLHVMLLRPWNIYCTFTLASSFSFLFYSSSSSSSYYYYYYYYYSVWIELWMWSEVFKNLHSLYPLSLFIYWCSREQSEPLAPSSGWNDAMDLHVRTTTAIGPTVPL